MSWNYRVCKETYKKNTEDEEEYFTMREVYYDGDTIVSITENAVGPSGYTLEELKFSLEKIQLALNKDIVDIDTLWKKN